MAITQSTFVARLIQTAGIGADLRTARAMLEAHAATLSDAQRIAADKAFVIAVASKYGCEAQPSKKNGILSGLTVVSEDKPTQDKARMCLSYGRGIIRGRVEDTRSPAERATQSVEFLAKRGDPEKLQAKIDSAYATLVACLAAGDARAVKAVRRLATKLP